MSNTAAIDTATTEPISQGAHKIGLGVILIPVLLSTVLTLGVVVGGGFYLLRSGKLGATAQGAATQPAAAPIIVVAPPASHVLALEPMIVNLSDAGGRAYLRASVSLRIKDEEKADKKEEKKDLKADTVATELRDTTLAVLSRQASDELLLPGGRETLKKALEHEYKERNTEVPVLEVYFTDFLVQRG
jgi:flagellar FliL protein